LTFGVEVEVQLPPSLPEFTEQQLQEEIAINLPPKWSFSFDSNEEETRWGVSVFDAEGKEVWKGANITSQLVLLETIGWLATRSHSPSDGSPWVRRRGELNSEKVHEILYSKVFDSREIPDLDPNEIASVYSKARKL
jgi:hypothetical protein